MKNLILTTFLIIAVSACNPSHNADYDINSFKDLPGDVTDIADNPDSATSTDLFGEGVDAVDTSDSNITIDSSETTDINDILTPDIDLEINHSDTWDTSDTTQSSDSTDVADLNDTTDPTDTGSIGDGLFVRIVAANLTSGKYQDYDYGHGINILESLNPDIVLVQEFNYHYNSDADYKDFSQTIVGTDFYAVDDSSFQIPNGIISKWPIISSGYWDDPNISNRELMWATIDIPGAVDIFAISVHLHTSPSADQVEAAVVIADRVQSHKIANPGKYLYVTGGDFNGTSAVSSNGFGKNNAFYVSEPHPVDDEGNVNTNANRSNQYDFVLADPTMHTFQIPVVFRSVQDSTTRTYNDGLVFDTRTFSQAELDEFFPPARTGDSGASSMQHMAVVKDFVIK